MITCPERDAGRKATLASLAASDWADLPLKVLVDPERDRDRIRRINRQFLHALQEFLDHSAEYLLLLEDDLIFNRHLRHNLTHWRPFRCRELAVAGLCNFGHREIAFDVPHHAVVVDPESAYGCQSTLLSRAAAEFLVQAWNTLDAPADLRLMHLTAKLGPLYYHSPSLIQHRRLRSTLDTAPAEAADFDPDWRANTSDGIATPFRSASQR
jgi:hypothetical protein